MATIRFTGKTLDMSLSLEYSNVVCFTRIAQVGEHKVRVVVHRDFYASQSSAYAQVLTPELTWTELASESAREWHSLTPGDLRGRVPSAAPYERLAERLFKRARKILA